MEQHGFGAPKHVTSWQNPTKTIRAMSLRLTSPSTKRMRHRTRGKKNQKKERTRQTTKNVATKILKHIPRKKEQTNPKRLKKGTNKTTRVLRRRKRRVC